MAENEECMGICQWWGGAPAFFLSLGQKQGWICIVHVLLIAISQPSQFSTDPCQPGVCTRSTPVPNTQVDP